MSVVVITPPDPVVSLDLVKRHLRADGTEDDVLIRAYLAAATGHIDGPGGWLGRAVGLQTLEVALPSFGVCRDTGLIRLPYPPLVELVSVKYLDADGDEQDMDIADCRATLGGVANGVRPGFGLVWPNTATDMEAVKVRYIAGYDDLPPAILTAILLMVGDLYANRETTAAGIVGAVPMSTTVEALLAPFKVWTV